MQSIQSAFLNLPASARLLVLITVCAVSGFALGMLHVPLPFLLGALFTSAIFALTGLSVRVADELRQGGQIAAGFAVGLYFEPTVALHLLKLGWLMVLTGLGSVLVSLALARVLTSFGGADRRTAFFSALPGGLAEMAVLAHTFGANTTLVSLAQSLRVVIIVLTIPAAMTFFFVAGPVAIVERPQLAWHILLPGIAAAVPIAVLLSRMKLFNPALIAGLAAGMAVALLIAQSTRAPAMVTVAAQLAIGAALGCRFQRESVRQALTTPFLPMCILTTLLLIAANVLFAAIASSYVPFTTGVLAMAPGGIAEMSLTAEALALAPPIVAAWQLTRILIVALASAPLYKLFERLSRSS